MRARLGRVKPHANGDVEGVLTALSVPSGQLLLRLLPL
jgi:hypothetical protein